MSEHDEYNELLSIVGDIVEAGHMDQEGLARLRAHLGALPLAAPPVDAVPGEPVAWHDVRAERLRQVSIEGWTPKHDDEHSTGSMALAAACYACNAATWAQRDPSIPATDYAKFSTPGFRWPWAMEWWKPKSQRQDLVRAAALILAEIERVDRRTARGPICSDCGAKKDGPHNYGCMYSNLDV